MTRANDLFNVSHEHTGGENLEVMRNAENYNRFLRNLIRRFAGNPKTALDFGAGIGTFSNSLQIPPGQVHCIEPDLSARQMLSEKGHIPSENLSAVPDASIDYVFTLNVLEHIADDAEAVRALYRVLRPGGRLFVYVPAFMLLFTSMDAHVGHHRRYRLTQLQRLLTDAGFDIEKKAYTDALGFFATLAFKLVDKPEPAPLNPAMVRIYDRYLFPLSRILSVPLARILGKNVYIVATRPNQRAGNQ